MPGAPSGPRVLQHQHVVRRHVEIVALDLARHVIIVLEHHRRAAVLQQALVGCGRLHHAAARRKIAVQHGGRAFGIQRVVSGRMTSGR